MDDLTTLLEFEQKVVEAERPFNPQIKPGPARYYDIEKLIRQNDTFMCVGTEAKRIVATGYAQIRQSTEYLCHSQHAYLGFMYVSTEFRGKGVNKALMQHLLAWCRSQGVDAAYLDVYSENSAAVRAYEKIGFQASMTEMKLHL